MMEILKPALAAIVTIVVMDAIFLGYIATSFYVRSLSEVANIVEGKIQPVYWGAGVVYVLLVIGILVFVLPGTASLPLLQVFLRGATIGLVVYGVYDFTNFSTLKQYPLILALVDTAWGSLVCGTASLVAAFVQRIS